MRLEDWLKTLQQNMTLTGPAPAVDTSPADEASSEENIRYLEWLMTWYCQRPSLFLANVIVSRLEALRLQEHNGELSQSEWSCQRLIRNWQYIAERQRARR